MFAWNASEIPPPTCTTSSLQINHISTSSKALYLSLRAAGGIRNTVYGRFSFVFLQKFPWLGADRVPALLILSLLITIILIILTLISSKQEITALDLAGCCRNNWRRLWETLLEIMLLWLQDAVHSHESYRAIGSSRSPRLNRQPSQRVSRPLSRLKLSTGQQAVQPGPTTIRPKYISRCN
ncbi:hypothetical protein ACLB2K_019295 [Fragaria x ananassa]